MNKIGMYVLYILPLSNKKKETLDGDVRVETACHVLLQFLKEWDKGYQGSSRESGEDISGYWGRKILTLYTLLWMPNPCKLFHAKQWWLREVSALFLHFSFHYSVQWAINLLVINKSTQNHYKFKPSFPRRFFIQ